jgi:ribosomal protein S16
MVVIRLSRGGSKKRPYFNVVVAESSKKEMADSSSVLVFIIQALEKDLKLLG